MFANIPAVRSVVLLCLLIVNVNGNEADTVVVHGGDNIETTENVPPAICPILVEVSAIKRSGGAIETIPVSGVLVAIEDNGLEEGLADKMFRQRRAILDACKIKRTDGFGQTIAYIMVPDKFTSGNPSTHSIKMRGTLVIKADGYVPFSKSLEAILNAAEEDSRFTFKDNVVPCCRIYLFPIEGKKMSEPGNNRKRGS